MLEDLHPQRAWPWLSCSSIETPKHKFWKLGRSTPGTAGLPQEESNKAPCLPWLKVGLARKFRGRPTILLQGCTSPPSHVPGAPPLLAHPSPTAASRPSTPHTLPAAGSAQLPAAALLHSRFQTALAPGPCSWTCHLLLRRYEVHLLEETCSSSRKCSLQQIIARVG